MLADSSRASTESFLPLAESGRPHRTLSRCAIAKPQKVLHAVHAPRRQGFVPALFDCLEGATAHSFLRAAGGMEHNIETLRLDSG